MYKILLLILIYLMGIQYIANAEPTPTPGAEPIIDIASVLDIDNPIIYFDLIASTPCFPYLIEDDNAYYCNANKVIYYGNKLSTEHPRIVKYFALAHEHGHANDPNYIKYFNNVFMREQFADCEGGKDMRQLYLIEYINLTDLQQLWEFLYSLPTNDHGTPQQRYAAFAQGYLYENCKTYH